MLYNIDLNILTVCMKTLITTTPTFRDQLSIVKVYCGLLSRNFRDDHEKIYELHGIVSYMVLIQHY